MPASAERLAHSVGAEDLADWNLFLIVWYPHSGCRWINRGLLARHPGIAMSEYFCPFLTIGTDMVLRLDKTSQVHKSRSMREHAAEFEIVHRSVEAGRRAALVSYFADKRAAARARFPARLCGGVLPCGADIAVPDYPLLFSVLPRLRIVHLVRHPLGCFGSFVSRRELDGDPVQVGASWAAFNAATRAACAPLAAAGRYRLLRYEDVIAEPAATLSSLCDWIGVPFDPAIRGGMAEYHGRNAGDDPAAGETGARAAVLMSLARGEAREYGYGEQPA